MSAGELLNAVALRVATPGPFMLFRTFVVHVGRGLIGAVPATLFGFIASLVLVLAGARYIEPLPHNRPIQSFLAGVSAALVGVILVLPLDLIAGAISGLPSMAMAAIAFLAITIVSVDVARVPLRAMLAGISYAALHALR